MAAACKSRPVARPVLRRPDVSADGLAGAVQQPQRAQRWTGYLNARAPNPCVLVALSASPVAADNSEHSVRLPFSGSACRACRDACACDAVAKEAMRVQWGTIRSPDAMVRVVTVEAYAALSSANEAAAWSCTGSEQPELVQDTCRRNNTARACALACRLARRSGPQAGLVAQPPVCMWHTVKAWSRPPEAGTCSCMSEISCASMFRSG